MKPHQEYDATERCPVGRDPREMDVAELNALGHHKRGLLAVIRQNCIECAGDSVAEVRRCAHVGCPFWPYRLNTNPFSERPPMSEANKAAATERFRALRAQKAATS